jgi:hypothetical protein
MNSKILAALDNIFTKDCDNLDYFTNMFQNAKFCNVNNNNTENISYNNNNNNHQEMAYPSDFMINNYNYNNNNNNNNNSNSNYSLMKNSKINHNQLNNNNNIINNNENCGNLLKNKNLQSMLPNPIMIGNTKTKKLFKNFLEIDNCASLHETESIDSSQQSSSSNSNNPESLNNRNNLRKCLPIECASSKCAQTLMKFNLPDFVKTSSNQTPSLTLAELDSKKLKFLTRINKTNEYGAEQFISYKFEVQPNS